jgi:glycosyltransferase involved in cell wall biosynthesis
MNKISKKIAVIVPAYNEELLIKKTILSIPEYVHKIIIINDHSTDKTQTIVESLQSSIKKIELVNLKKNSGVGFAIITGYKIAYESMCDIGVVMPGDAQALPEDFENLITPVIEEKVDYTKGNRLNYRGVSKIMPKHRFFGNSLLTILTKFATGYYHITDPQMGYTALNMKLYPILNLDKLIKRYGYPGHLLYLLNMIDAKVQDVDVIPHYGEEKSGIKLITFVPKLIYILLKLFFSRIFLKLLFKNTSPAGISFLFAITNLFIIIPILSIRSYYNFQLKGYVPELTFISLTTSIILFFIFFLFGIVFDIQENNSNMNK